MHPSLSLRGAWVSKTPNEKQNSANNSAYTPHPLQLLEHHAVCLQDLFGLSKNSDARTLRRVRVMCFFSWGRPREFSEPRINNLRKAWDECTLLTAYYVCVKWSLFYLDLIIFKFSFICNNVTYKMWRHTLREPLGHRRSPIYAPFLASPNALNWWTAPLQYIYTYTYIFFFLYDGIVYTDRGQKPLNLCDTQEIRP